MKVGIITWHYYPNFGSSLQVFALQEVVRQLGASVYILNYRNPKLNHISEQKEYSRYLLSLSLGKMVKRFSYPHLYFMRKYLNQTHVSYSNDEIIEQTEDLDLVICGSDQIWAPNVFNPVYFATFAKPETRKISYAASIGLNDLPEDLVPEYKRLLSDFSAISIREDEGKELLKKRCGIESTVVLDPTLLHDTDYYKRIQRRVHGIKGKYLFCYFLNENHHYKEKVEKYAKAHDLKIIGVSARKDDSVWMNTLTNLGADHYLWLIDNADAVMTDSYHGTIFSLLYHKDFWTFVRFAEDSPICQNSRIRQLQSYFGNTVRVVGQKDDIDELTEPNFSDFEERLKPLRSASLSFLKTALMSC